MLQAVVRKTGLQTAHLNKVRGQRFDIWSIAGFRLLLK